MRNIPVFSTDFGVASLVLDQIPYRQTAYVHIRAASQPEEFVRECAQFCRAAGADLVLATGHRVLESYPLQYELVSMCRPLEGLADTDAALMPVTEETLSRWMQLYNDKMSAVDGAAYMSSREGRQLLQEGHGYFIHREGQLLGIGKAYDETISALAACRAGFGETVLLALCHALTGPMIRLEVASTNSRALRLYERLGFIRSAIRSAWYRVL